MACDKELIKTKLADARDAYHQLLTGRMARVFVDQNGERVEFTATNRAGLAAYIRELEGQLGYPSCGSSAPAPLRFLF